MNAGKTDGFDQPFRFFKLFLCFPGESGQYIRGEGRAGEFPAQVFNSPEILGGIVTAFHPAKDSVAAGLQGQVKLGADFIRLLQGSGS